MNLFIKLFLGMFLFTLSPILSVSTSSQDEWLSISFVNMTYATKNYIIVPITTKIPGCTPVTKDGSEYKGKDPEYCKITKWFGGVMEVIGKLIKAGTFLTLLVGVIFIIIQGIALSSGMWEVAVIKKRLWFGVIGIAMLALSGTILNMIAPWIYV